jgi:cell division protein FtsZ
MNIYVSPDVALEDAELASTLIAQEANPEANIIWGVTFDENLDDEMRITIVATGFEKKPEDENRVIRKVETNPESPFRKDAPVQKAAPAAAPAAQPAAKPAAPAAQPVKKPVKPAAKPADDDDFGDLFDMFKKK